MQKIAEGKRVVVYERDGWEFVERKSATEAVAIIALNERGELILTEQFRKPVNARVIDIPAGLVGDEGGHDDPAETAKKELEEETGHRCDSVERVAKGPSSPGITSEIVTLYRAHGARRTSEGGGVGGENITVHTVPLDDIETWLEEKEHEGVLVDLKVWAALYFAVTR